MNRAERRRRTELVRSNRISLVLKIAPSALMKRAAKGMCRDRHPLDCGRPRCFCCHAEKLNQKKSRDGEGNWVEMAQSW